jgi:dTDP-4-amino-4,6-dideoxygalactose transaminase
MGATETSHDSLIPLFDLRLTEADRVAVAQTLRSGWLTMGPRTAAFEAAFAEMLGARHAVAVSSCTAALHLCYLGARIGPGDEVIVPSCTMAATAAAVLHAGGTPVFADIASLEEPHIDPRHVEALITPRTMAVVAMHFAGYGAAMSQLKQVCDRHGVALLEDAAHSPLAEVGGRRLGTWGLASAFSFFSNKVLSAGEGGMVVTDNDEIAAYARAARSHLLSRSTWDRHRQLGDHYDVIGLGFNYRLDEPRSALLHSRLARLGADIDQRRALTLRYRRMLAGIPGLAVPFDDADVGSSSAYVMPVIVTEIERRDAVRVALRDVHAVQTSVFYPAVHMLSAYAARYPGVSLPLTEHWSAGEITLPLFPHMTHAEQDRVVEALATELRR